MTDNIFYIFFSVVVILSIIIVYSRRGENKVKHVKKTEPIKDICQEKPESSIKNLNKSVSDKNLFEDLYEESLVFGSTDYFKLDSKIIRQFKEALKSLQFKLSNSYGMILQIAIPYFINWLIHKKRGD